MSRGFLNAFALERIVVDLDFFGAYSSLAFELLGRHEEIEQGKAGRIHYGQESLFLKAGKPVLADLFTNYRAIFLFVKAVYRFSGGRGCG
jgi:hypothetical protein